MLELKASFYAKNLLDGGDAGSAELTGAGGIMLSHPDFHYLLPPPE
jgi:hypothetical protein